MQTSIRILQLLTTNGDAHFGVHKLRQYGIRLDEFNKRFCPGASSMSKYTTAVLFRKAPGRPVAMVEWEKRQLSRLSAPGF
jgi:hypothetical protein